MNRKYNVNVKFNIKIALFTTIFTPLLLVFEANQFLIILFLFLFFLLFGLRNENKWISFRKRKD